MLLEYPFRFTINAANNLNSHFNIEIELNSFKYIEQVIELIQPRHRTHSDTYGFIRDKIIISIKKRFETNEFENKHIKALRDLQN